MLYFLSKYKQVIVTLLLVISSAYAEQPMQMPTQAASGRIWNLQDADILSVITEVSEETGKNFVVDPRVMGKISLVSSKPLRHEEVYEVFLSILEMLGYSAIPSGGVIKIIPNIDGGEQATRIATIHSPGKGDETVVRIMRLENATAPQLVPMIRPLLPQWGNVTAYAPGNILIVVGHAANLKRISRIVAELDKAANISVQIVPLRHASAVQLAVVLNNIQSAARATGEPAAVSIAVDERSNSLLISGSQIARGRLRALIMQLDTPASMSTGNTEVIYLRYLEAKNLAPLLSKIAANIQGKNIPIASNASFSTPAGAPAGGGNSGGLSKEAEMATNIQAEPNINAVIITASPTLMRALKAVIAKLDIRPAQVMVEAIIAEVDESNITNLGIQWGSVTPNGELQTSANGSSITAFPNYGAGVVGVMPSVQIQAVLSALQNQNGVDILSTPTIMVLDNQKATIEIGQNVPFQTGAYATTGNATTATPFTTNNYVPVTLKLDVTPQINLGSAVRLKLNLKNDTLQNPQNPGLTPIINTSKIANSVIINSENVLVLGGLMSRSNNDNANKVPILSHIPIVGYLFRQETNNQQKKTLMVFIKPIIVRNNDGATTLSQAAYSNVRKTQANYTDDLLSIGDQPVDTRLPPWKNKKDLPTPFASQAVSQETK
ncbi:MAG TPA: type II secretion system secretin GspD [Gammaproteobacteria bacterium]|jgi:general secretion pathway protein D|nr:type II secretion system secretin GspD [Gammaproteobacteria bacterium]